MFLSLAGSCKFFKSTCKTKAVRIEIPSTRSEDLLRHCRLRLAPPCDHEVASLYIYAYIQRHSWRRYPTPVATPKLLMICRRTLEVMGGINQSPSQHNHQKTCLAATKGRPPMDGSIILILISPSLGLRGAVHERAEASASDPSWSWCDSRIPRIGSWLSCVHIL